MADTEAAEGPGVGHEQRSRIGGRWERHSHPLTGRRSTQRNPMADPVPAIVDLLTARKAFLVKELDETQHQHAILDVRLYTLMSEIKAIAAYLNTVAGAAEGIRTKEGNGNHP